MTAVAVTPRAFRAAAEGFLEPLAAAGIEVRRPAVDRPLEEPEMLELVAGCAGLIVGVDPVTEAVLAAGPLRIVVKYGSGLDNVDLGAAGRLGVAVEAIPGANARSVAELAVAMLLALARHLTAHDRSVREGSWARRTGVELAGRRLGVVGYGAVGREVAAIGAALGMEVVAHDPLVAEAGVPLVELDELLRDCDAVSLHLPLTAETRHLIGERELGLMREGALLVNTSRGGIVDEAALARALESGRLGGAGLDVFEEEPPAGSPLLRLDNVIASPHAGAATVEAAARTAVRAVELLLAGLTEEGAR